jgi:hypothetical protein
MISEENKKPKLRFSSSRMESWHRLLGVRWWYYDPLNEWTLTIGLWFFEITIDRSHDDLPF